MICSICNKEGLKGTIYRGLGICSDCGREGHDFDMEGNIRKGGIIVKKKEVEKKKKSIKLK